MALPWIYRGPCSVGYSCADIMEDMSAIEQINGIPIARLESGVKVLVTQVTTSVEIG